MKDELGNHLKKTRLRLGLSQQDLATRVGVSRQTISGVESGQTALSVTVALRLAKVLGCRVEDLFWLNQPPVVLMATPSQSMPLEQSIRVSLAKVSGQWVAHPLVGQDAFRTELIPADGETLRHALEGEVAVTLLDDPSYLLNTAVVAGCSPALSLWARAAERWHPELRVHLTFANSMTALEWLMQGEVHLAGVHLYCSSTQTFNIPFVQQAMVEAQRSQTAVLINLGTWAEGFLVAPGNPKAIHTPADLGRPDVRLVNREPGAGSRLLLDQLLQEMQISQDSLLGYGHIVRDHQAVAEAISAGIADVGVSAAAVAQTYHLDFIPLRQSRYDLVTFQSYLEDAPVKQLLGTLGHQRVVSQLALLGGYDTQLTGEVIALLPPEASLPSGCSQRQT